MAALVTPPECQALREKFAKAHELVEQEAFWRSVQAARQERAVETTRAVPAYLSRWSYDSMGTPIDDDFVTVIG